MPNSEDLTGEFVIDDNNSTADKKEAGQPVKPAEEHHGHPTNKAHFFSNLCLYPSNVTFENQEAGEEIVLLVRRDLITNLPWIIAALILIIIPFVIMRFSSLFTPFFNLSTTTQTIAVLFYFLIIFGFILIQFTLWYFNVGLVTTKRIIDFNVYGILSKQVSETKLNLVEDVTYNQVGAIRSVFDYGDVLIQTAATTENFEFDRAPEPARIVRIISDLIGGPR